MRRYNQTLYRVLKGYLSGEEEIEDVMQTTYLKAYQKLAQFRGKAAFSTWLIRIGINEALMQLRKQHRTMHINDYEHDQWDFVPNQQSDPENQFTYKEMQEMLEKAIVTLPEKYRIVYILKEVEGMAPGEIADCLQLSVGSVKVRLHRAKKQIRKKLSAVFEEVRVFKFGNERCDRVVRRVMRWIK